MAKTILIVDDNATDRMVLRGFLKRDYTVIDVGSGAATLSVLGEKGSTISAILLDLVMPEMDGFNVLRQIRENDVFRQVPVIVASAQNDDETQVRALSLGAAGFAFKPYNRDILLHLLENTISLREKSALYNSISIDLLTGLMNRTAFFLQAAERIKEHGAGYYVLTCFDIENFKVINDQYGLDTGDKILKEIAQQISRAMVPLGGLCCHDAADKFGMLYPASYAGSDEIKKLHEAAMSSKILGHGMKVRIGRYYVNDIDLPVNTMYDRATMAEESIKGRYDTHIAEYTEEMRLRLVNEQQVVNDMGRALKAGEFEPWFQPQYNHSTGALIGAEALVRWRKDGKIIPPNDFIAIFERNGFIYEVDQYIWRSVCLLLRRWLDEGKNPLPVSVNISRYDLLQKDFMDKICSLTEEYRLPPGLLRLEVTESAFTKSTGTVYAVVNALIQKGFTVEIDDFGSGYSSLNTLKDVPASILKLDMRFFEETGNAKRGGNIIESVVRMAKWLGMAVIAEGVEDKAQADYLKSIGCYYIQGYYYAKPMPAEEYEKRLDASAKEAHLTRLQTLKNLDNNDFWDSRSMDTLIFNSYVGAACILELNRGKIEMLRATDYFVHMLGGDALDIKDVLAIDWAAHLDTRSVCHFTDAVLESMETKEIVNVECEFHGLPGCPETVILRCSLRVIATAGERTLVYCLSENMTAQREAERVALIASERVSAVMDNSHCGISAAIPHADGTVELIFVNNRFYELLGYTAEQYAAEVKNPYDRVVPEDRDRVFNTVTKLNEIGSTVSMEVRQMRRDGSIVWLRCDASIVKFANIAEPVQMSSFLDITAQKENELKQTESARQLELIMSNVNGGITATVYHDEANVELVFSNESFYEMYGYTKEQWETEVPNILDLIFEEDRKKTMETVARIVRERGSETYEYRCRKRDGGTVWIQCTNSVFSLEGMGGTVLLAVTTDVTELRTAQREQLAATDRLRTVINAMSNGMTAVVFHSDGIEFLFANNRYYEIYGIHRGDVGEKHVSDALRYVLAAYRDAVRKAIYEALETGKTHCIEYQIRRPDGIIRWVRVTINMVKLADIDDPVQVAVLSDITDEKESTDQLRFLNDIAHDILSQSDSEQAIHDTLTDLMSYFSADRCYVIEVNKQCRMLDNTYEVCAEGVKPEMENWQALAYTAWDDCYEPLSHNKFLMIADVNAMDNEHAALREMLLSQGIRSVILAPLWRDGCLIGYAGLDNPTRTFHQLEQLKALADYITFLLTRRDLVRKIKHDGETVQQLIDDTPGGFVRMAIYPHRHPTIESFNDGFCQMLRMTREELLAAYGDNVFACLADDDAAAATEEIAKASASAGQYTSTFRLRQKNGSLIRAMVFGRFARDENGRLFLNAYFTDTTAKLAAEENQKALLDNLPFGAAMYAFDGAHLKALHINRQYQLMVGRTRNSATIEGYSPTDFIHPDDRTAALQAIRDAIAGHRDASCNIRILYGEGEYRSFHLDARITAQPDGNYLVYVAYTRLSEQEMTFENALPHMFSTIMESSTDLAFAKDIDFRYICCSRTFATLLGLKSEKEVVGKTDYELFPQEIADMFRRDDSALFATKKPQIDVREMLPSPDGTKHYIRTSKHLLRNNTDDVIGIYCIGRDITEVHEAYARLRLLTDSIPGGIATFRCASGNLETVYFNDGVCALAGFSREEFDAHPIPLLDLVFAEDRHVIRQQIALLESGGKNFNFTLRIHTKNGGYKWVNSVATATDHADDVYQVSAVLTDVTEQQEEKERLRLAEEEYRIATRHSGHTIGRYDIASQTLTISEDASVKLALPESIPGVPYDRVKRGKISKATAKEYIAFYEKIMHGEKDCSATFQKLLSTGWRWITERATTIFDDNGKPVSAIISYFDVTEQQEKEAVYKKWQQTLTQKGSKSYTLYRCNLSRNSSYETVEGALLNIHESWDASEVKTFNERTQDFCAHCVVEEDQSMYLRFVNFDTMLAGYYRGKRSASIEFRGHVATGEIRWLRLSVELVEYPNTKDVAAYLMFEDINESKLQALKTQTMAQTDPLTGLLNRKTFVARMDEMLAARTGNKLYALVLLDVDGFKLFNDSFGHAVGDQVLIDTARAIQSVLRESDLVCRLGGDEFLICMAAMPDKNMILQKTKQILGLMHNIVRLEVKLSVSAGIAACPNDGSTFETLYPKADKALYHVKDHGKDNCVFYDADMKTAIIGTDERFLTSIAPAEKPTMLIVDDNKVNRKLMSGVFASDFKVEAAEDGASALTYLRHNAKDVAVVLLELMLPDIDGFAVLEHIQALESSANIPVVVVSGMDERDAAVRAIKAGASDFVTKPVDPTLLRIRVESAVSKAENERLRAQNRFLALLKTREK